MDYKINIIEKALYYSKRGWHLFPLHKALPGGVCTCGNKECIKNAGKHPRTVNGLKAATIDEERIKAFGDQWAVSNIAIATGVLSGIVVLDIDRRNGGFESLALLEEEIGKFPKTVSALTGGGGIHLVFKHPGFSMKCRTNFRPGLDFKGDGGYIVAEPSIHRFGKAYAWSVDEHPEDTELAPLPEKLIELLVDKRKETKSDKQSEDTIGEGSRNSFLASIAGSMRYRGCSEESIIAALIEENEKRCKPPLEKDEVIRIAKSISRYESSTTYKTSEPDEQEMPVIAPEAFHGLAGKIVNAISPHTESHPVALLLQFVTAFGNCVGRKPFFLVEATKHFLIFFTLLLGDTSKARKGTSWDHIAKLFSSVAPDWEQNCTESGLSSGEGVIWRIRDEIKKGGKIEDQGVDDKRVLFLETEYARVLRVLGRESNILSAVLRDMWDGKNLRNTTKNSPAKASNPHGSIIGHITKEEFVRYLSLTDAANGYGNRHLLALIGRSKILPFGGNVRAVDFTEIHQSLRCAIEFSQNVSEITFDEESKTIWEKIYGPLSEGKRGLFGSLVARGEAQVVRLALAYCLLDCSNLVTKKHLYAALAVWDYCEESCKHTFGVGSGIPLADEILDELSMASDGLTRTEIRNAFNRNTRPGELKKAFSHLLRNRLAFCRIEKKENGRPVERWFVNEEATTKTTKPNGGVMSFRSYLDLAKNNGGTNV